MRMKTFEKEYNESVIRPACDDMNYKFKGKRFLPFDISDLVLMAAIAFFVICFGKILRQKLSHKAISGNDLMLLGFALLFMILGIIIVYIYNTCVIYNESYYDEYQEKRVEKAGPFWEKKGYKTIESIQALAQRYMQTHENAKEIASGKWEIFFLTCNSILILTTWLLDKKDIFCILENYPVIAWFIMLLLIMPVIAVLVRRMCYAVLWPVTRQYILSDLLVIIEYKTRGIPVTPIKKESVFCVLFHQLLSKIHKGE